MNHIVVFGSINIDLVTRTPRLPRPGETLTGRSFATIPGGKGANQAVACARLGVPTHMIGRVGGDVFGQALLDSLQNNGVQTEGVLVDESTSSGVAAIAVDDDGENNIIVVPGANGQVNTADLERLAAVLPEAAVLLLQLEIPLEMVAAAAQLAQEQGVTVILDPAPAQPLPDTLYPLIDILTPNETEAAALVGFEVESQAAAHTAAQQLRDKGAKQIIIKRGGHGVYNFDGHTVIEQPAFPVTAVDTVAAGDAFNGSLAAALAEGLPLATALQWGCAGGAIAVTRAGAQPAMPKRGELVALLADGMHR